MRTEKDFEELLKLFNKHKVKYCIIGAFAVGFYAKPRYTKDLDILVEPSIKNGTNIVKALKEFGFGSLSITPSDFAEKGKFIQLGYEPIRIDLITSVPGCLFETIWKHKKSGGYNKERVYFIGIDDLIRNKRASNRSQDKADLEILLSYRKHKTRNR